MIEIKVKEIGKSKIDVEAKGEIKGYNNAVHQFVAVIMALDNMSKDVLTDAIGEYIELEIEGGDDDDESEG